ncbi:MAG: hypothetical protein F4145_10285 [Boseongicola sp. SB0675_bin_26]|nr:hypothetical protein [Boseongicola sp. SB0675_bin_26]
MIGSVGSARNPAHGFATRPCLPAPVASKQCLAFLDHVADVHGWLKGGTDRTFHFAPTSAFWMNVVEGFVSKQSRQRLKNAVFDSLDECIAAIESCIKHHNANHARPFRWSRKPEDLVAAWKRGHQKLQDMASNE